MNRFFKILATIFISFLVINCSTKKEITETKSSLEVQSPFTGDEYKSDKLFLRVQAYGMSSNDVVSCKKAKSNLYEELQKQVKLLISEKKIPKNAVVIEYTIGEGYPLKAIPCEEYILYHLRKDIKIIEEKSFIKDNIYYCWIITELEKTKIETLFNEYYIEGKYYSL